MGGVLTIQGNQTDTQVGTITIGPFQFPMSQVSEITLVPVDSAFHAVAVPTGCTGVIFAMPATLTQVVTLKGPTGDTGNPIGNATNQEPSMLSLCGQATVGLLMGGTQAGVNVSCWFF